MALKTHILTKAGFRAGGFSRGWLCLGLAFDGALRERLPGVPSRLKMTASSNGKHSEKGAHYGPRYEAFDAESKPIKTPAAKRAFLRTVMVKLRDGKVLVKKNGTKVFTRRYFGWLEREGGRREHFHWQVRRGRTIVP